MFRAALLLALVVAANAHAKEVALGKYLTNGFVGILQKYKWFEMGSGQGYTGYAAQIECAADEGTSVPATGVKCHIRPPQGFSRVASKNLVINDAGFNRTLIEVLSDNGFGYMINVDGDDNIGAVGGIVSCEVDTGAKTPPSPPSCSLHTTMFRD